MTLGFKGHFTTLARHWGKVLTIVVTCFFVATAVSFMVSKVYVSEARMLILSRSQAERATNARFTESDRNASPQEQVLTQVQIAQSPIIAQRLALKLGPQRVLDEMTWRWDWVRELPRKVKDNVIETLAGWEPTEQVLRAAKLWPPRKAGDGPPVLAAMDKILDNLSVEAIAKTDMFVVAYEAPSAEFAALIVEELMGMYVDHVVALNSPSVASEIAQREAKRLETDLRMAEQELRAFTKKQNILSIERQMALLLDRYSRIEEELLKAKRVVLEADQKIEAIKDRLARQTSDQSVTMTTRANPILDSYRERLLELRAEQRKFVSGSRSFERVSRDIAALEQQIANADIAVTGSKTTSASGFLQQLKTSLIQEETERDASLVRIDVISAQLKDIDTEIRRLDAQQLNYGELKRNVETKEKAYLFAVQQREESAITSLLTDTNLSQVVAVEPANLPDVASKPRRIRTMALGLIVGIMVGVAMAYLLEFGRKTFSTPKEVGFALGKRVLASFWRPRLFNSKKTENHFEYRNLSSQLVNAYQTDQGRAKVIMFSTPNDTSPDNLDMEQLGEALSMHCKRVVHLNISADKAGERPSISTVKTYGAPLTEASVEAAEAEPEDGKPTADASVANIDHKPLFDRLKELLEDRSLNDEYILIDCPPLNEFPEMLYLMPLVGCFVPVIEADHTRVAEAQELIDRIEAAGGTIPGVILSKQRYRNSSWAFSWSAQSKRKSASMKTA